MEVTAIKRSETDSTVISLENIPNEIDKEIKRLRRMNIHEKDAFYIISTSENKGMRLFVAQNSGNPRILQHLSQDSVIEISKAAKTKLESVLRRG